MAVRRRLLILCALLAAPAARAAAPDASYAQGYADALLDELGLRGSTASVDGGTVTVSAPGLGLAEKDGLARALRRVPGVTTVRFKQPARPRSGAGLGFLPGRPLFDPLLADPRWPRLSGTMARYGNNGLGRVWAADFGGGLPIVGGDAGAGRWQWGAQACVFTLWDMDTLSNDHLNADYLVGFPVFWRWDRFSLMTRLYHVSTHLGDEYMLTHPDVARVNLSYEALDAVASYQALDPLRVYAGAGRMIRRDPKDTPPGSLQAGVEYLHPRAYWRQWLRPVAALDLQKHQKSGWGATDVSARAGVSLEHRTRSWRRALLLLEFYRGKDPNGQFFRRTVQHAGLGLTVYY